MHAFKQAVKILADEPYPLVIFPEGEVYHCNDRVTPFREGAAAVAFSAKKCSKRPIVCIPCALKYRYEEDPTEELLEVMGKLEERIFFRPRADMALLKRINRFADALLAVKEIEFLGQPGTGTLSGRIKSLSEQVLSRLEMRYEVLHGDSTVPERVKELRRRILSLLDNENLSSQEQEQSLSDLDDVFFVIQLFSYPGDYVSEQANVERIAETIDKFEEDVLGKYSASVRAKRSVTVTFGKPVPVEGQRAAQRELTDKLEQCVQEMIAGIAQ